MYFAFVGEPTEEKVQYAERFLEFMIDLMAQLPTRRFFHLLLDDSHLIPHCRLSAFIKKPEARLAQAHFYFCQNSIFTFFMHQTDCLSSWLMACVIMWSSRWTTTQENPSPMKKWPRIIADAFRAFKRAFSSSSLKSFAHLHYPTSEPLSPAGVYSLSLASFSPST